MSRIKRSELETQAEFLGLMIHSYRPGRARLYQAEHRDGHRSHFMPIREFSAYLDGFERAHREHPAPQVLQEMLELLEEHEPTWYLVGHYRRMCAALGTQAEEVLQRNERR